ncbi:MAG TPA: hypothetical protein VIQ24_13605 [Pyrinomonadaceae bacterium]
MSQIQGWLPFLSEQWATTYLQILFGLMVFALGIPALAFELIVQEDVRHVVQRRWHLKVWLALVFMLFISSILFVWLLHPLQDGKGGMPAGEDPWAWKMSVAAAVLLTLVPSLTFAGGWMLFDRCRRVKVVGSVAKSLAQSYDSRRMLDESDLEDLLYLGTHGKAGRQKNMVLDVIGETAAKVQQPEADYNGSELEDLIRGIEAVLRYENQRGNDENFTRAVAILKNIWFRLSTNNHTYSSDATATLDTLKVLGIFAVKHRSEPTALIYVEEAAVCDSDILFEMGVAALQARHFFIASAALVKLESLASQILEEGGALEADEPRVQARDSPLEVKSNLVGLLAHFSAAGVSARRRALLSFETNAEYFTPTRVTAFNEAFEYHYNMGRFETSDKVFALPKLLGDDGVPDWRAGGA